MKRFIVLLLIWIPTLLLAQSSNISTLFTGNFRKAEILYNQFAYRNALQLYLFVVEKNPANYVARQRIADCYFRLGEIEEAEKWYAELAKTPDINPKYKYQYAQILSIQRKYADSQKWFGEYLAGASGDPRTASKLEFINHLNYYLRDSILYTIKNEPYNSDQSDFAPHYYEDGIVFVSARNHDFFVKRQSFAALNDHEAMLNVFYAPFKAKVEKDATLFYKHDLNSPYHDGPVCFYQGGKRIVFSRSNLKAGKPVPFSGRVNLELYFAETNERNKLSHLEAFPLNSNAYSIGHPWISDDGNTLYFVSDMPGGEGGTDIYKSEKKSGKWEAPQNLGPAVNTLGNEFYPFVANDTTLYFSSDGHGGLGGLDIYVWYRNGSAHHLPKNLGFPLNTSSDDFSLIVDKSGRNGLFSSNRSGGAGYDDIYNFIAKSYFLEGKVVQRNDSTQIIPDAKVMLKNEAGRVIDSVYSDSKGHFGFDLPFDKDYSFAASKEGYGWIDVLRFSTRSRVMGHSTLQVPLWKHSLFAKGIVYSNESQKKLPKATVRLKNFTDGTVDSVVTDQTGAYSFVLEPGKKYSIHAQEKGFLPQEIHLNTKGLSQGDLLNDLVLEEEFMDKVVIQFDFDKAHIRQSEIQKLERLHKDLNRRPRARLRVSAFADSYGTHEYNQALSDKRAMSVLKYFTSIGINVSRIEAKGFGETLPLNHCSDGAECNEEDHSKNRRVELKVQLEK